MINRRKFLLRSLAGSLGVSLPTALGAVPVPRKEYEGPVFISTWQHGLPANKTALQILEGRGSILDAVEAGVKKSEADPEVTSVGYGGLPDSNGEVTLDACIMDHLGNAGSVACLKEIMHPVSVARLVMEKTPHVMLVGKGARDFAVSEGFNRENLLTEQARKAWEKFKSGGKPVGHDTIGLVGMDSSGRMAGACTTSGLGFKMPGRVGDSPIIGAGLFVDNEVGAATATGHGELVMKTLGSFLVVELMRGGLSPEEACRKVLERMNMKLRLKPEEQIGFIALDRSGQAAGFGLRKGFSYALSRGGENKLHEAPGLL